MKKPTTGRSRSRFGSDRVLPNRDRKRVGALATGC
jgi:hypothetical protein